ncbi:MAG TPA: choice-of-anchor V domain-containing protein, partial [Usitatibacteraceae bacterium]|nr:choice-of-anchor V domain-containing protein [Usitatibacteraceae bacterium]
MAHKLHRSGCLQARIEVDSAHEQVCRGLHRWCRTLAMPRWVHRNAFEPVQAGSIAYPVVGTPGWQLRVNGLSFARMRLLAPSRRATGKGATALACLLAGSLAFFGNEAIAYSSGITGRTNKDGGTGCGSCHSPNQTLVVSITGPSTLAAGTSATYTVNISGGTASTKMGVNIAASSNNLSESSTYLQKPDDDLTHTSTDLNTSGTGAGSFTFTFTMPSGLAVGSTRTLYAAARVNTEWNHATNFVITVPKLNQTITFPAQTSPRTYSTGATFSISPVATASSGLAITYTSDTPAVCTTPGTTSTTVTMQGAGTCTIRANQNGNATYNAAPDVTRSITINKGNQSITFGSQVVTPSFATGGSFNLSPAATASSGLAIVYSSTTSGICTKPSSGTLVNMVAAGLCSITAAQPGDANWNAALSVSRSITISKGNQTITFPAQSNKAFVAGGTFSVSGVSASSGLA